MGILKDLKIAKQKMDNTREIMICSKETYNQVIKTSKFPPNVFVVEDSHVEFGKSYIITNEEMKTVYFDYIQKGIIKTLN